MKKLLFYSAAIISITLFSCNQEQLKQQADQIKSLKNEDSLRLLSIQSKDSALTSYVKSINRIETNLDSLKQRSKILSISGESKKDTAAIMADLNAINNLIIQNKMEIADLERKVRNGAVKNKDLENIIVRLNSEVSKRDSQITVLQNNLASTNTTLQGVIKKLNDTMGVATQQRAQIGDMTTKMHTVYYTFGKKKDLELKGIISKQGGFIGIGKTAVLSPSVNASKFTQADLTKVTSIMLNGKLDKIVTSHPDGSYKIVAGVTSDQITITDQESFWSRSKYFVATVK